jgi:nitrous oxidase accessory protein
MKKTCLFILFILLSSFFIGISSVENIKASGNTLYVDDDGTADYTSIQNAIDNATAGDTIYVNNGLYNENIVVGIGKSVDIQGESKYNTIVDGGNSGSVFFINADHVSVSGFTIRNSGGGGSYPDYHSGINLRTHNITVTNNIIENNSNGLVTSYYDTQTYGYGGQNCDHLIISENIFQNNTNGMFLDEIFYSEIFDNTLKNNKAEDSVDGTSIQANSCEYCSFYENKISNCNDAFFFYHSDNNIIYLNEIMNTTGLIVQSGYKNKIIGNTLTENSRGIGIVGESNNNSFYLNNLIENKEDVTQGYEICNNEFDNGQYGNYWSSFEAFDNNSDGIADEPYIKIKDGHPQDHESTIIDNYPLMKTWQSKFTETQIEQIAKGKTLGNDEETNQTSKEENNKGKNNGDGGFLPGFEIIFLIAAALIIIFWKRKK